MACGTGKTLAARFLHYALGSRRTLVLVPSLSLVRQTLREWLSVTPLDYLAVCSDETVAAADHDAVIASTSELGVPVTTDPGEIAAFLRRRRPGVVFATYQSSPRIADAQQGRVPAFDLAPRSAGSASTGASRGHRRATSRPRRCSHGLNDEGPQSAGHQQLVERTQRRARCLISGQHSSRNLSASSSGTR